MAELGSAADTVVADVTVVADCERMVAETVERHGRLDVLVNCAGVWVEGPTAEMTEKEWDRTLDVNLKGTFFACRYAIPHLERTEGCIVNLSSDAGLVGTVETAIYNASKGGVSLLTRSLALELAPKGVRVNAVCPNESKRRCSPVRRATTAATTPEGYLAALVGNYPQKDRARFIRPGEINRADRLSRVGRGGPPSPARASRSTSGAPPATDEVGGTGCVIGEQERWS